MLIGFMGSLIVFCKSENSFASIFIAYIAAFADLLTPTETTGEPEGISVIDNNESNPPNAENFEVSDFFCDPYRCILKLVHQ